MYNFSGKGSQRGRFCLALIRKEPKGTVLFGPDSQLERIVQKGAKQNRPLWLPPKRKAPVRTPWFVGEDGFEPPKSKDSRFTVCPIWPLWNSPGLKPVRQLLAGKTGDILLDLLTLV